MNKLLLVTTAIATIILFFGCKKDAPPVVISKTLSITSITPAQGAGGIRVTIKGANFGINTTDNLVLFHTDTATVNIVSADSLVVTAPLHGTTGPVSVTVGGETAVGPVFTYLADTTGTDTTHPAEDSVDIYAAGYDSRPVYWKNGIEYNLVHQGNASYSSAYAIALVDTDVYIAGTDDTKGKYWKNTFETVLSNPDFQGGEARSIMVSGNDIYIGGADHSQPAYWKNGVETILNSNGGVINAIAIYSGDVYAAGRLGGNAVIWKNGVADTLSSIDGTSVQATGVILLGSDIYVCGEEAGDAVLWKNGVKTVLAPVASNGVSSKAYAIAVAGNNILVVGNDGVNAAYWLNGAEQKLTDKGYLAVATAIAFYKDDVYIAGADGSQFNAPVYWKNGVRYQIPSGINSTAYAITVVKHR